MTLSKRIIPCLDVKEGRVVKGEHFVNLKDAGDPVELGSKYRDDGADELVFLDITASPEKRKTVSEMVCNVASKLDIPFTVGGGISSIEDARNILCSGADKVGINTMAIEKPELITEISERFGRQCCVVAIDAKRNENNMFEVFSYGARKSTGIDAIQWSQEVEKLGAGEILLTSIDRDGTEDGFDVELTKEIVDKVNIPVIASGGCGSMEHFVDVFNKTNVDAALAASVFHYNQFNVEALKRFLKENGVLVRT